MITSRHHPRIRFLASLQDARHRYEHAVTLGEGWRLAEEAFRSGISVQALLLSESGRKEAMRHGLLEAAERSNCEILEMTDACYAKFSHLQSPDGVAVLLPLLSHPLEELVTPEARLLVACGVQDPGNAGALIRVAEAAGASGCIFLEGVDLSHPKLLRATMGGIFRLPCSQESEASFLSLVSQKGIRIVAAGTFPDAVDFEEANYRPPLAICVGGEGAGIPPSIRKAAHTQVVIPMAGRVESLNVAVAAGILLYRARKDWAAF